MERKILPTSNITPGFCFLTNLRECHVGKFETNWPLFVQMYANVTENTHVQPLDGYQVYKNLKVVLMLATKFYRTVMVRD